MSPLVNWRPGFARAPIYSWGDIDILHKYVKSFFNEYNLQARKYIDYYMWSIVLNCHKLGYIYTPEGRELVVEISNCINKKRYSTNEMAAKLPDQKKIDELFKKPAPFNIYAAELSHEEKAKSFAIKKGSRQGFKVYVYEKVDAQARSAPGPTLIQVKGSPFNSYNAAQKTLKLSNRIVFRYIDTGKYYKDKCAHQPGWWGPHTPSVGALFLSNHLTPAPSAREKS